MLYNHFKESLQGEVLPRELNKLQQGLWYAAKGNWEKAHDIAQEHEGEQDFDRLHAYLHRVEGDEGNARYWYRRAGSQLPAGTVEEELEVLIRQWI